MVCLALPFQIQINFFFPPPKICATLVSLSQTSIHFIHSLHNENLFISRQCQTWGLRITECLDELIVVLNYVLGLDQSLINDDEFRKALYVIDIGQNDIADSFAKSMSYVQVVKRIPLVTTEINNAVKVNN